MNESVKIWLLVGVTVVSVALVSLGVVAVWQKLAAPPETAVTADCLGEAKCLPGVSISSPTVTTSSGTATSGRPEPYSHTTWLMRSTDGVNWTIVKKLLEHTSVPEIVRWPDGTLAVYGVDFTGASQDGEEQIALSRSSDGGTTWTPATLISLKGKTAAGPAVDPAVVVLADGRFRLYYYVMAPIQKGQAPAPSEKHVFYSAISADGLNFTQEDGTRFEAAEITDPEVIQLPDGSWIMYISRGQNTLLATSADGLEFSQSGQTLDKGGVPGAVVLTDGTVRWYGCGEGGIITATARDGLNFGAQQAASLSPEPTDPVICDPSVVLLPDGNFIGVLKTAPSQAQAGGGPAGLQKPAANMKE